MQCLIFLSLQGPGDLRVCDLPLLCAGVSEMKTMHNVSLVNVIPFANPHPYDLSCSPKGIHCSELTHTCAHTHTCARCSWVTGTGIKVIPCWWLKSVDNRDVSKGDQSRLAQDTARGLVGLPVINTGCYLGAGSLTSPHWGNTGSAISMEEKC